MNSMLAAVRAAALESGRAPPVVDTTQEDRMPETLTGRLRWLAAEGGNVLQQEWSITSGDAGAETTTTEWRNVPVEGAAETPESPTDTPVEPAASAGPAASAEAERQRILGVQACSMPGHEALIAEMVADGKTTPEQAAHRVLQAERGRGGQRLAAIKEVETAAAAVQSAPHTDAGPAKPKADTPEAWREEFAGSPALQTEFSSADAYVSYQQGVASGRIRVINKR